MFDEDRQEEDELDEQEENARLQEETVGCLGESVRESESSYDSAAKRKSSDGSGGSTSSDGEDPCVIKILQVSLVFFDSKVSVLSFLFNNF